ncbi:N-acetylglucosamine-6-phosphate deacetylase [Psychromonas sp. 14N.309.X.WAT.B.A12]|uniref:N-acetylglucosamine-6-phosphate deacetylase n=1 Tax=Psychromonas sp. 14N.309.X.WAT.B.A12 TaxID=2998322 RepID=UPI0025AFB5A3|nr:N-acetylglucosamine-6-phosphate deacetylase [Psychromonas sp. 14N.309.X.WAT.B.A12]MDN2662765.1 N-acetylglucosamine-6-phosphate deacetylase [Psychromonas sp. 14N.309.X.WAT.B.A12]
MYALVNGIIYSPESVLTDHAVIIEGQLINAIVPVADLPSSLAKIDLQGQHLSPGFIDLQLNGCGGVMFNGSESEQTLSIMHSANLKSGTTSFLPTFITDSDQGIEKAMAATRQYMQTTSNQVLGLHLEGPYISQEKKGIHPAQWIRPAEAEMVDLICKNADIVAQITIAPEKMPLEFIKQLSDAGIVVSLGHSNANYQQATLAIEQGASFATHLFNAMSPMTGREPGMVGAIYDHQLYAGIIVDGFHVAYENIRISKRLMGDKLILVTDATAPAGADIEQFDFVGTEVYYKDGKCVGKDGTLGGSAVTMIESIQQCVEHVGIPLDEAIRMASYYPAKAIAVDHKLGSITAGKVANLTIFDQQFNVTATIVNGYHQLTI